MFVVIQNCATNIGKPLNDLPIVVDNFALSPWRAKTRTINPMGSSVYRFWESWDDQFAWLDTEKGWAVLEGWIGTSAASSLNELQLERSRANPALVQAIVSPVLTNGIGSITFNHRATNGKVVFAIERTSSNGDQSDYNVSHPLAVVTNSSNISTPFFLPIRELFTGRVRVRLLPESDPYAVLKIDDLLVRDYPPRDETTWQAYNMLITSTQTNRVFDGQSGFLNKAPDIGTAGSANLNSPGTEILSESRPFIQSPQVDTGVGEISFWYRAWDTNGAGRIEIKVAASLDAPENQWRTVADFTVTNIEYQVFKIEPYDITNKVLRIYSHTNGYNRVGLDNIMMTEPVRAGYDIKFVRLLLDQPLENQMVGVEVEIGRFVMNPSNIQVFVSYHTTPTEVWGYTNWWTMNDTAGSRLLELEEVAPRVYRTANNNGIPAFPVDTPVQFVAWGTHADLPPEADKIFQPTNTFTNPEWYYPRDMNGPATAPINGLGAQGWSPYYFVYSCKPGAVWINEFNYYRIPADNGFEFVEIAGPANTLIGGWRIESININNANDVLDYCEVNSGFRLGNNGNGWGFFVWGDSGVNNVDQTFRTVATANLPQNGGIRLVRSMGAWEQRLAYGPSRANLMPAGYEDSGMAKPLSGTPQVVALIGSGKVYSDFMWVLLTGAATRTPGAENTSQVLDPIQAESFMIFSVVGDHGSHNIGQSQIASIEVESGHSTQIVYTADQWFRIASFKSNGQNVPQAVGASNYVWIVGSVSQDYSNDVTFAAATAAEVGIAPVNPAWARGFYASEAAALADASLATDYLLNLNPTVEYDIGLTFNTIERDNDQVSVAVVLKDGGTNLTTTINGVLKLQGKENLTDGVWQDIGSAAINNASFINGTNLVIFTEVTNNFFQAVIEPLN
jgi:hypothetical protein